MCEEAAFWSRSSYGRGTPYYGVERLIQQKEATASTEVCIQHVGMQKGYALRLGGAHNKHRLVGYSDIKGYCSKSRAFVLLVGIGPDLFRKGQVVVEAKRRLSAVCFRTRAAAAARTLVAQPA